MFQTSPFVRLSLTPFLVIFLVSMPFLVNLKTTMAFLVLVVMELIVVFLLAGMWLPAHRGQWYLRQLALLVFITLLAGMASDRSQNKISVVKIMMLVGIGLPCLSYALKWNKPV